MYTSSMPTFKAAYYKNHVTWFYLWMHGLAHLGYIANHTKQAEVGHPGYSSTTWFRIHEREIHAVDQDIQAKFCDVYKNSQLLGKFRV